MGFKFIPKAYQVLKEIFMVLIPMGKLKKPNKLKNLIFSLLVLFWANFTIESFALGFFNV